MNRIKKAFYWITYPTRTSELIVASVFTWWIVAIIVRSSDSFSSDIYQNLADSPVLLAIICFAMVLVWLNYFRLIDKIREWVQMVPVLLGVYTTVLVGLATPHHPSTGMGFYIGITFLAIFVCINNTKIIQKK